MPNINNPTGFSFVKGMTDAARLTRCFVPASDSTPLFAGDPVVLAGSADASGEAPTVTRMTAGSSAKQYGIVEGVIASENELKYRAASTDRYILVRPVTGINELIVQANGVLAATDMGNDIDVTFAVAGNTVTGVSGAQIDVATIGTGSQFRMIRISGRTGNELGAFTRCVVTPLTYQLTDSAAGV